MNAQYSDSRLRGGLRNPDHTEDPITGPTWIRRHKTQRQNKQSKRQRDSLRETNTTKSFFTREFPVKARKQNPQNLF